MKMSISVLLLDDDELTNLYHKAVIEQTNLVDDILVQTSPSETLKLLSQGVERPAVLFMDLNMPEMDGWEFLEIYKKFPENKRARVTVILSTTISPQDKLQMETSSIVDRFYSKPLTEEMVKACLESMS